jgi:D-serine deaminase-like pyridoxal phosphate-dependent protein
MSGNFSSIERPTLIVDKEKCIANISKISSKVKNTNVSFRPHFKTHQSAEIGNWFRDFGVSKITVSSIAMAEKFINEGWNDILVAFTFNPREIRAANELVHKCNLHLLVESAETITFLSKNISGSTGVYIKIDAGYHRTGLQDNQLDEINDILRFIQQSKNLTFMGFLSHFGNSYHAKNKAEIKSIYQQSVAKLISLRNQFDERINISIGDTPSCSIIESFEQVDEIRPGNFIFYDLMQWQIGACELDEIATVVACPIVAKHKTRNEIVLYGGAVHLSKEALISDNRKPNYGMLTSWKGISWASEESENVIIRMSQEHGILLMKSEFNALSIGDLALVFPIHSCLSANLLDNNIVII